MTESWQYQVRIRLAPEYAALARQDPANEKLAPINTLLMRHGAHMKCQYDAFADYVAQAQRDGVEHYPLYRWTRETIENELSMGPRSEPTHIPNLAIRF